MAIIAQGSFSVVDYNDAITLTSFLRTTSAKSIVYDPNAATKYSPSWAASPYCDIYPSITKPKADGTGTLDITANLVNYKWSKVQGGTTTLLAWAVNASKSTTLTSCTTTGDTDIQLNESGATLSTLPPFGIRIKADKLTTSAPAIDYVFEAQYQDPATSLFLDVKATISFNLFQNGSNIAAAHAYAVGSDTFYNADDTASLIVGCDLLRGNDPDTTISYQWFKMDNSVFAPTTTTASAASAQKNVSVTTIANMAVGGKFKIGSEVKTITAITPGTAPAGTVTLDSNLANTYSSGTQVSNPDYDANAKVGWAKLAELTKHYEGVAGTRPASSSCNMTVYAVEVVAMQTYKCVIVDTESTNAYADTVTVFDTSDPIQVELFSPSGNAIRNGQGSIVISATIKRNGVVVTKKPDGTNYVVQFRKLEADGTPDPDFGGTGNQYITAGSVTYGGVTYQNAINVTADNVSKKAVFICEVS